MEIRQRDDAQARDGIGVITFKAIKPAIPFKSSIFRDEIKAAAAKMEKEILKDFQKTTATWEHKGKFNAEVKAGGDPSTGSGGGVGIDVTTKDKVYGYVDAGTKRHLIKAKRRGKRLLAFRTGGRPKTKPRVIGSTQGRKGTKQAFAKVVHHPGTKAREFSKTIGKKWQLQFRKEMDAAIKRAAKRSGHSAT